MTDHDNGMRVWLPSGSAAESLLIECKELQKVKIGWAMPHHMTIERGLKAVKKGLELMPDLPDIELGG